MSRLDEIERDNGWYLKPENKDHYSPVFEEMAYLLRVARAAEELATNHDDFNSKSGLPDPCDCAHCDLRRALEGCGE
jgi:hypothetical protein